MVKRTISTFDLQNLKSENRRLRKENEELKVMIEKLEQQLTEGK